VLVLKSSAEISAPVVEVEKVSLGFLARRRAEILNFVGIGRAWIEQGVRGFLTR